MLLAIRRLITKLPRPGEAVYWAPKGLEGRVEACFPRYFRFVAGEPVNHRGNMSPRWIVGANYDAAVWNESTKSWHVGQGLMPKNVRGKVVRPEPVKVKKGVGK